MKKERKKIKKYIRLLLEYRKNILDRKYSIDFEGRDIKVSQLENPYELENFYEFLDKKSIDRMLLNGAYFISAKKNEQFIGCFVLQMRENDTIFDPFVFNFKINKDIAYGTKLYVKPEFRNQGIAKIMYEKAFEIARNNKKKWFVVLIDYDNFASLGLIKNIGFKQKRCFLLIRTLGFDLKINESELTHGYVTILIYKFFRKIITFSGTN